MSASASDSKTKLTASDAFYCKFSATEAGYCDHLVNKRFFSEMKKELEKPKSTSLPSSSLSHASRTQKRSPILHRGYVARMEGQHIIIRKFLDAVQKRFTSSSDSASDKPEAQFLFLGCGFDVLPIDSLFFNEKDFNLSVFEVDFPDIIAHKHSCYKSSKELSSFLLGETVADEFATPISSFSSLSTSVSFSLGKLKLLGHDLREDGLDEKLVKLGLSPHIPTLIFTECVLVYMDAPSNLSLCQQVTRLFSQPSTDAQAPRLAAWISYDMINPGDRYGQMMIHNLSQSGYKLPGFLAYPTLEAHRARFSDASMALGLPASQTDADKHQETADNAWFVQNTSMLSFFNQVLSAETRKKICSRELLDEIEEWNLIMGHYCLTVATISSQASLPLAEDLREITKELTSPAPIARK